MAEFAHDLDAQRRLREIEKTLAKGGPPTDNGDMEARVKALEEAVKNLPTKADFADLRAEVKTGISDLRAEMHKGSIEIHKWMIGTVIGLFLGFGGLFLAMSNAMKPAQTATTQQPQTAPIIINVPSTPPAVPPSTAPHQ